MNFVNPIDLLGLHNVDPLSIDSVLIKKAKRKLFIEIDLSDSGYFDYNGIQLSKAECEKAIDLLEDKSYLEFYVYLVTNKNLNNFLINGSEDLFYNFRFDSIYNQAEFIRFINPYFAYKFDKAITKAFLSSDTSKVIKIIATQVLLNPENIKIGFSGLSYELEERIKDVQKLTASIKNGEGLYDANNIAEIVSLARKYFPNDILNILPKYFQSQINKIASALNYLQLAIWNEFSDAGCSLYILEHLLELKIESVDKQVFEKNYVIIKEKHRHQIHYKENEPVIKYWANKLKEIQSIDDKISKNEIQTAEIYKQIDLISISELNQLPDFADEIRASIAFALRGISVSLWNSRSDIDASLKILNRAVDINLSSEDKSKILSDYLKLKDIKREQEKAGKPLKNVPPLRTTNGVGTRIYGDTLYFVILNIPIFPIARYNCAETNNGYTFYGKLKLRNWQKLWFWGFFLGITLWILSVQFQESSTTNLIPENSALNNSEYQNSNTNTESNSNISNQVIPESIYKGNQLENGASPLDQCFGKGLYSGNAKLTIKNGGNSDAIVCLYDINRDRTIRNEYVRINSSFTMSKIPAGVYKIRVFYGNDWNPEIVNSCGTKGDFESDVHFSEFDGTEYFEDDVRGYTVATITLYSVAGGNATTTPIDKSNFFKK